MGLHTKEDLRKRMLEKRKTINIEKEAKLSSRIIENLLESTIYYQARHIMTYLSYPREVRTDELVLKSLNLKKEISVPICIRETKNLFPSQINALTEVENGFFGLREPKKEYITSIDIEKLDLIIVPGLVFDRQGNRIGHGAGYYDRFFERVPSSIPKVALAFQYQIVKEEWRVDAWDTPMNGIITEDGWLFKNF